VTPPPGGTDMTPHFPIYLDYGATTPVDQRVVDAMIPWLREHFGNPASRSHAWGWEAEAAVEKAREQVAALINADPRDRAELGVRAGQHAGQDLKNNDTPRQRRWT
jgi:selenocysteine lyase/cysteine desulfurase